jgi:preprotein translocase subunit SecF
LSGPGLGDLDVSLAKVTTVREHLRSQFRVEYFNVLNRANFSTPNPIVYTSATQVSPTAGLLTATATTSRQLQFALKLLF